jgi:hypothetical protein
MVDLYPSSIRPLLYASDGEDTTGPISIDQLIEMRLDIESIKSQL